jgi:hypothetical protein
VFEPETLRKVGVGCRQLMRWCGHIWQWLVLACRNEHESTPSLRGSIVGRLKYGHDE